MRRVSLFPRERRGLSVGVQAAISLCLRRGLGLLAVLAGLLGVALPAHAAPPPDKMPAGYTVQRIGAIRWTYPTSAEPEAKDLAREVDATWTALAERFGVRVSPDLDLRLALNPEQMQALAPP